MKYLWGESEGKLERGGRAWWGRARSDMRSELEGRNIYFKLLINQSFYRSVFFSGDRAHVVIPNKKLLVKCQQIFVRLRPENRCHFTHKTWIKWSIHCLFFSVDSHFQLYLQEVNKCIKINWTLCQSGGIKITGSLREEASRKLSQFQKSYRLNNRSDWGKNKFVSCPSWKVGTL